MIENAQREIRPQLDGGNSHGYAIQVVLEITRDGNVKVNYSDSRTHSMLWLGMSYDPLDAKCVHRSSSEFMIIHMIVEANQKNTHAQPAAQSICTVRVCCSVNFRMHKHARLREQYTKLSCCVWRAHDASKQVAFERANKKTRTHTHTHTIVIVHGFSAQC